MSNNTITRTDTFPQWAHAGAVEAGGFIFTSYCVGNIDQDVEAQINGAFDHLAQRLATVGLTLASVVKIDALFRDIWDIPVMEKVLKERYPDGQFPARKSLQTAFAHDGLKFQLDAIAYRG